ncbi:hypothetical protein ABGN05_22640 [Aquibium sp. LZ166]|uniref:Sulfotransferase family protein n=1 Tax=Aquibium pacificus TaxID=3153579 RepID=A0ABV3SNU3_9HYPH
MNIREAEFLARHSSVRVLPEGAKVVHGHFWARKYEAVENAVRITFLREPVRRTLSHYFYWLATPAGGHSLHQHVLDTRMDIVTFARLPQMSGFYRDFFFRDVDLSTFDFVGDGDKLDEELLRLEDILGVTGPRQAENANPMSGYAQHSQDVMGNDLVMGELRDILGPEIEFFHANTTRL